MTCTRCSIEVVPTKYGLGHVCPTPFRHYPHVRASSPAAKTPTPASGVAVEEVTSLPSPRSEPLGRPVSVVGNPRSTSTYAGRPSGSGVVTRTPMSPGR